MKKIKHLALGLLGAALLTTGLFSCSDEETNHLQQEDVKTEAMSAKEYTPSFNIGIVKWDWHRESRDCKRGFGICNTVWFPGFGPDPGANPIKTPTLPEPEYEHTISPTYMSLSSENVNENNELNFEVHINEEVNDPNNVIPLTIDNDIYFSSPDGVLYKIKAGIYNYDINIGEYGGYSIN